MTDLDRARTALHAAAHELYPDADFARLEDAAVAFAEALAASKTATPEQSLYETVQDAIESARDKHGIRLTMNASGFALLAAEVALLLGIGSSDVEVLPTGPRSVRVTALGETVYV